MAFALILAALGASAAAFFSALAVHGGDAASSVARASRYLPAHVVDIGLTANRVEEPHPIDDFGQQLDIVADDDQPAVVGFEEVPPPADRVGVQVVGGLVQQQRHCRAGTGVGCGEQYSGQLDLRARPPDNVRSCWARTRSARPRLAQIRLDRSPPRTPVPRNSFFELTVTVDSFPGRRQSTTSAINACCFEVGQQRVESTRRQHPVPGQNLEITLARVLWQVADITGNTHVIRTPRRASPSPPGSAWRWSCRRRCGRPGRSDRPVAPAGPPPSVSQQRAPGADLEVRWVIKGETAGYFSVYLS